MSILLTTAGCDVWVQGREVEKGTLGRRGKGGEVREKKRENECVCHTTHVSHHIKSDARLGLNRPLQQNEQQKRGERRRKWRQRQQQLRQNPSRRRRQQQQGGPQPTGTAMASTKEQPSQYRLPGPPLQWLPKRGAGNINGMKLGCGGQPSY